MLWKSSTQQVFVSSVQAQLVTSYYADSYHSEPINMFTLSSSHRFHLYSEPTDMRKSFDGLSGLIQNTLERDPRNGSVFMFINKKRDKLKLLHWQGVGYTLYYKRLESGTFELPEYDINSGSIKIDYAQMIMIIDGLSIENITRRKRYKSTTKVG